MIPVKFGEFLPSSLGGDVVESKLLTDSRWMMNNGRTIDGSPKANILWSQNSTSAYGSGELKHCKHILCSTDVVFKFI